MVTGMRGNRGEEGSVLSFDVKGTAMDSSPDGELLVIAGLRALNVISIEGSSASSGVLGNPSTTSSSWLRLRTNRQLVRRLRFHPTRSDLIAALSGSEVDVYELGGSSTRACSFRLPSTPINSIIVKNATQPKLVSTLQSEHALRLSDLSWSAHNDTLLACCSELDSAVNLWDVRHPRRPCNTLELVFGAGQAKLSPHHEHLLMTSHGCDLRLWDLRQVKQPLNQWTAHESRIQCLEWHPQAHSCFATSAIEGTLKLWELADSEQDTHSQLLVPNIPQTVKVKAWRFRFSPSGEELATLSLPSTSDSPNSVQIYSLHTLEQSRQLKSVDEHDIAMDICWVAHRQRHAFGRHHYHHQQLKAAKYLFALTKKHRLCRHPIAYEMAREIRDEMATPISQSIVDEERDRLAAERATALFSVNSDTSGERASSDGTLRESTDSTLKEGGGRTLTSPLHFNTTFTMAMVPKAVGMQFFSGSGTGGGNLLTPQSPIISQWNRFIKTPNITGGDYWDQLSALRRHTLTELRTYEVNYDRGAIGFEYFHWNKCKTIKFEMRVHKLFAKNGLVWVEVLQKDSPMTGENAALFLQLLQAECDKQYEMIGNEINGESSKADLWHSREECDGNCKLGETAPTGDVERPTILWLALQELPKIVDSMHIFTPSIDVPSAEAKGQAISTTDMVKTASGSRHNTAKEDNGVPDSVASSVAEGGRSSECSRNEEESNNEADGGSGSKPHSLKQPPFGPTGEGEEGVPRNMGTMAPLVGSAKNSGAGRVKVAYTPSAYDHLVPAPRNGGARFNSAGHMVAFGRAGYALHFDPHPHPHHHHQRMVSYRSTKASTGSDFLASATTPNSLTFIASPPKSSRQTASSAPTSNQPASESAAAEVFAPMAGSALTPPSASSLSKKISRAHQPQQHHRHRVHSRATRKELEKFDKDTAGEQLATQLSSRQRKIATIVHASAGASAAIDHMHRNSNESSAGNELGVSAAAAATMVPTGEWTSSSYGLPDTTQLRGGSHRHYASQSGSLKRGAGQPKLSSLAYAPSLSTTPSMRYNTLKGSPSRNPRSLSEYSYTVTPLHEVSAPMGTTGVAAFPIPTAGSSSVQQRHKPSVFHGRDSGGALGTSPSAASRLYQYYSNNTAVAPSSSEQQVISIVTPARNPTGALGAAENYASATVRSTSLHNFAPLTSAAAAAASAAAPMRQRLSSEVVHSTHPPVSIHPLPQPSQPLPIASSLASVTDAYSETNATGAVQITRESWSERTASQFPPHHASTPATATMSNFLLPVAMTAEPMLHPTVLIYDASGLLPVSRHLAGSYRLISDDGTRTGLARWNLKCAESIGRRDLTTVWQLLEQCALQYEGENGVKQSQGNVDNGAITVKRVGGRSFRNDARGWLGSLNGAHLLGRELINSLLDHYSKANDVQTAAAIACVLGGCYCKDVGAAKGETESDSSEGREVHSRVASSNHSASPPYVTPTTAATSPEFAVESQSRSMAPSQLQPSPFLPGSSLLFGNSSKTKKPKKSGLFWSSALTTTSDEEPSPASGNNIKPAQPLIPNKRPPSRKTSLATTSGAAPLDPSMGTLNEDSRSRATSRESSPLPTRVTEEGTRFARLHRHSDTHHQGSPKEEKWEKSGRKEEKNIQINNAANNHQLLQQRQETLLNDLLVGGGQSTTASEQLLDSALARKINDVRLQYASILFRWRMFLKCAEVMKCCSWSENAGGNRDPQPATAAPTDVRSENPLQLLGLISTLRWCGHCNQCSSAPSSKNRCCAACKRPPLRCAVCDLPCHGSTATCSLCAHGGHTGHMFEWFRSQTQCPSGCGCMCRI